MAPELSPDNGTTSTNSTSPALSSTLSESSSLMDSNMIQQNSTANIGQQQIQVVRNIQQSPGRNSSSSSSSTTSKMPENILDTNAFDNKTESSSPCYNNHNNNNLLIMANEHKDFSCSIGDESNHVSSPISNNNKSNNNPEDDNDNAMAEKISESDEKSQESRDSKQLNLTETASSNKNANISVASNIANAFINLSTLNSSALPKSNNNGNSSASSGLAQAKNVNLIVTQQPLSTQQFMKTLSFTTSRGIFVPNVIATNIAPQFTVHQYGLHGSNQNGPAPNVTVNPNGNFNTNSNATIRPGISNHFRLLLQQPSTNVNFNLINQNTSQNPSPILEASLQSIAKEANLQASKVFPTKTIYPNQIIHPQRSATPLTTVVQPQKQNEDTDNNQSDESSSANSTDQHIRVLTPSEIMKTLPSLSSHDNASFNSMSSTTNTNTVDKQSADTDPINSSKKTQNQEPSGSVSSIISNNSAISSPMTITTITSECCNTFSSHFTITKATAMSSTTSNNAQIIMVRGYKTYKNIFFFLFIFFFL